MNSEYIFVCPDDDNYEPDSRGLAAVLFEAIENNGDKIAQIDAETGKSQTYSDLQLQAIRLAQNMQQKMGIKPKDVVILCSHNTLESYVAFLATLYTGAYAASLDPTLAPNDVGHLLKQVEPKLIFCSEDSLKMIENESKEIGIEPKLINFGENKDFTSFLELLEPTGQEKEFKPYVVKDIFETVVIFFSSGTTGLPKGICATHYGLLSKFDVNNDSSKLSYHNLNVFLYFTSLYWISAVAIFVLMALRGSVRLLGRKFEPEKTYQLIETYKVTTMFLSPYLMNCWLKYNHSENYDNTSLSTLLVGGGYIAEEQIKTLRRKLPNTTIFNVYGLTEAHGGLTSFDFNTEKEMALAKPMSVGRPMQGLTYKLVDLETDEICGPNQPGEIRVKGKSLMSGYYNKPKESSEAWDEEGYLRTGDIGYYDEERCFYIIDRAKEMFRYQSWHITPADLETILLSHPEVQEAAVIGIPHEVDGEWPMGVVVKKSGSKVTENEILTFFNDQVSDRKKLRAGVKFVSSLPYTPTGKLQRRRVKQLFKDIRLGIKSPV